MEEGDNSGGMDEAVRTFVADQVGQVGKGNVIQRKRVRSRIRIA